MAVFRETDHGSYGDPTIARFVGRQLKKAVGRCGCTDRQKRRGHCRRCGRVTS
jgi:hypothetical protein